jgi:inorganic triphosphatase YgiF
MERELKFLLESPHLPSLPPGYLAGTAQPILHLLDEYLDYRDQILAAGWRLRRRRSDSEALRYTLKSERNSGTTGPLSERIEIERTPEAHEELPVEIATTLTQAGLDVPHVLSRLQPYLTLRQERQPIALSHSGKEIALLSVDTVRASGSATDEECHWSELEIEFLDTVSPEACIRAASELAVWLAAQEGVTPAGQSKVARAAELLSIAL